LPELISLGEPILDRLQAGKRPTPS